MMNWRFFAFAFQLTGCGGAEFDAFGSAPTTTDGRAVDSTEDSGAGGASVASGGAPTVGDDGGSGGSSGSAGGREAEGSGGEADAGSASDSGRSCITDLSGVGTGDFQISFTLTTTENMRTLALLSQRTGCDDTSAFWDIVVGPTGGITATTYDGTHRAAVEAGNSLNDGKPHRVDVIRREGMFWYASDGVMNSAPTPDPYSFGKLPLLLIGSSACSWASSAVGHATISDLCITER
jgi:hypothetical protein